MGKISLIIKREYFTRVKKRSFILMTLIGPLLITALIWAQAKLIEIENEQHHTIAVIDKSYVFKGTLKDSKNITFQFVNFELPDIQKNFEHLDYYAVLYIPENVLASETIQLFSDKQASVSVQLYIKNLVDEFVESSQLQRKYNIPDMASIKKDVKLQFIEWTIEGEEKKANYEIRQVIGWLCGIFIFFFIFMYAVQVMKGVIEEKTNRIIEVIITSVKPFQLMMGKIIGIALISLTQFLVWIILSFIFVSMVQHLFMDNATEQFQAISLSETFGNAQNQQIDPLVNENSEQIKEIFGTLKLIRFDVIIPMFMFFFLFGYLLYAALFAAVGATADSETDTQQFVLPVMLPLVLSFIMLPIVLSNPDGVIAKWLSIIPITSPIVMITRIPFGVPIAELITSMVLLLAMFIFATWFAAKIYRTGILMYGKKVSYKEVWKWIRYSR